MSEGIKKGTKEEKKIKSKRKKSLNEMRKKADN